MPAEESSQVPFVGHSGRGMQSGGGRAMERSLSSETPAGDCSGADSPRRGRWARNSEREREREIERTQVPHLSSAGQGINRGGSFDGADLRDWMHELSARLKRVRLIHGSWDRCMNMHYGDKGKNAAVFFDPPYVAYER